VIRGVLLAFVALVAAASAIADDLDPPGFEPLVGAAAGRNLWFALPDPEQPRRSRVMHHATDRDPPTVRVAAVLDGAIEAMAAWEDRVWVVLAPRAGRSPRREVVTLETARNPASGLDYSWPREGPTLLPSIPGTARLLAAGADANGPVVLLAADEVRSAREATRSDGSRAPQLLRLARGGRWEEVAWPEGPAVPQAPLRLADGRGSGRGVWLVGADPEDRQGTLVVAVGREAAGDGLGRLERWPIAPRRILAASVVLGQPVLLLRPEFGRLEVVYPRDGGVLRLADLPPPAGRWLLAGTSEGLRLVEAVGETPRILRIDPLDGRLSEPEPLGPPRFASRSWLHLPLLGMLAVAAVLALVLFKPLQEPPEWTLPAPWRPTPPLPRLGALLIDALPGTLVAMAWFGVGPLDLALLPAWSLEAERAVPSAVAVGLTALWCTLWETLFRTTPGKRAIGASVWGLDGRPATRRAVLLRNLFKSVVLFAPVLAIFMVVNPRGRGVGEVVSHTVVAWRRPEAAEAPPAE